MLCHVNEAAVKSQKQQMSHIFTTFCQIMIRIVLWADKTSMYLCAVYPAWCVCTWPKELQLYFAFIIFITLTAKKKNLFLFSAVHLFLMRFHWRGKHYLWIVTCKWAWSPVLAGCQANLQPNQHGYFSPSRSSRTKKSANVVCSTLCVDTKPYVFKLRIFFVKYLRFSSLKIHFYHLKKEMGAQVQLQILSTND